MLHDRAAVKDVFVDQSEVYRSVVGAIRSEDLGCPAGGEWAVGELLGHSVLIYTTIEAALGVPPPSGQPTPWLETAAEFLSVGLDSDPELHQGIAVAAGPSLTSLGSDPVAGAISISHRVDEVVREAEALDAPCRTFAGWMPFGEFLVTRVMESVLHCADLEVALGREVHADPRAAVMTRDLLLALVDRLDPLTLARGLSGRALVNVLG